MTSDRVQISDQHRKITFIMEQDEDGWPPDTIETVWAVQVGEGLFRLDNIPFFATGVALGDVVSAEPSCGELLFKRVVCASGHSTIRIIYLDETVRDESCQLLVEKGCGWEGSHIDGLISVDVPPSIAYSEVQVWLAKGHEAGLWDYEEACLGSKGV